MPDLVYLVATSVDGFITTEPSVDPHFLALAGPHSHDLITEFPEMTPGHLWDAVGIPPDTPNRRFDTVLMGRHTYDIGRVAGVASPYPHLRQIVVSRTLGDSPHPAVEVVAADVTASVRTLKTNGARDVWLCGGGALAATVYAEIDELILKISPVVVGAGVPLFAGRVGPQRWTMTQHRVYDNGFSIVRYRRAGANA